MLIPRLALNQGLWKASPFLGQHREAVSADEGAEFAGLAIILFIPVKNVNLPSVTATPWFPSQGPRLRSE